MKGKKKKFRIICMFYEWQKFAMQIAISLPLPIQLVGKTANAEYAISNNMFRCLRSFFCFLLVHFRPISSGRFIESSTAHPHFQTPITLD